MNAIILDNKKGKATASSKNFGGVRYNTNKMEANKGELMALRNFGAIQNDTTLKPEEVKQYLLSVANLNPKVEKKQFHATITCKGKEYDKHQLTEAAHDWVKKMGYAGNPYIVVFHNDTEHNHVHIVSSRIDIRTGKRIPDSFENVRAVKAIDQVVKEKYGIDRKLANSDFSLYNVTTLSQLKLLYETSGHSMSERAGELSFYNRDSLVKSFDLKKLMADIGENKEDKKRTQQLKALFEKYLSEHGGELKPQHQNLAGQREGKIIGYNSEFSEFMRDRFGLQFVFHFKDEKTPYGYSIIDHKSKAVFKGSSIMKLSQLTKSPDHRVKLSHYEKQGFLLDGFNTNSVSHFKILAKKYKVPAHRVPVSERVLQKDEIVYYKDLLRFFLRDRELTDLESINLEIVKEDGKWFVLDTGGKTILDAREILPED